MSIPKIIHFCWLSGEPYPELVQHCMDSWKKVLPDYEIMLWDAKRFDVNSVPWVKQACEAKKWAFAADYIRLYALYNYGGIYLDSDVEVLKSFSDLLELPNFFGREHTPDRIENQNSIEAATMGCEKGNEFIGACLNYYQNRQFTNADGSFSPETLPTIMARVQKSFENLNVFPMDYFSPKNTRTLVVEKTVNTYSVHHFNGSWHSIAQQKHVALRTKLCKRFGEGVGEFLATVGAVFINIKYEGVKTTMRKVARKGR